MPETDPWEEEAKAFKAKGGTASPAAPAPAASSEPDWKVWTQGGDGSSQQSTNPGHAPTFGDQAMDSARFLSNEAIGVGKGLISPITSAINRVANPPDYEHTPMVNPTALSEHPLAKLRAVTAPQFQSGDMKGLAQNFGVLGGQALLSKAGDVAALPGAIRDASASPVGAGLMAAGKAAAPALLRNIPVVGKAIGAGMDAYKAATEPPPPQTAPIPPVKFNPLPKPPKPMATIPRVKYNAAPEAPQPMAEVPPVQYNPNSKFIGTPRTPPLPKPEPLRTAAIPAVQWHSAEPPSPVQIMPRPPKPMALRTVRPPLPLKK